MDKADLLKEFNIEKLVNETNEKKQIRILQEINRTILTKYVIQICDLTIEPLWVEAYYYDKKSFPDCNTHMSNKQKNRFGQLYFHEKGYGGLDICLSHNDSYYLSVLLKATLIYSKCDGCADKEFKKQTGIYDILTKTGLSKSDIEAMDNVLVKSEKAENRKEGQVINAVRVNLQKPCFKDALLAACPLNALLDGYNISFPNGYRKQWKCSVRALSEIRDEEKAREKAREYNNNTKIEDKYWNLAKESLGYNSL